MAVTEMPFHRVEHESQPWPIPQILKTKINKQITGERPRGYPHSSFYKR